MLPSTPPPNVRLSPPPTLGRHPRAHAHAHDSRQTPRRSPIFGPRARSSRPLVGPLFESATPASSPEQSVRLVPCLPAAVVRLRQRPLCVRKRGRRLDLDSHAHTRISIAPQLPWAGHGEASASPTAALVNGQASGSEGRRSSFSGSEDGSGSPTRTRVQGAGPAGSCARGTASAGWPRSMSPRAGSAYRLIDTPCRAEAAHRRRGIPEEKGKLLHAHLLDV